MPKAYITKVSKLLPNDPVANDEMESVLGMVGGKPSKARALTLKSNKIKTRYYALKDGKATHTQMHNSRPRQSNKFLKMVSIGKS